MMYIQCTMNGHDVRIPRIPTKRNRRGSSSAQLLSKLGSYRIMIMNKFHANKNELSFNNNNSDGYDHAVIPYHTKTIKNMNQTKKQKLSNPILLQNYWIGSVCCCGVWKVKWAVILSVFNPPKVAKNKDTVN